MDDSVYINCRKVVLEGKDCLARAGEDTAKISLYLDWVDREEIFNQLMEKRYVARAEGMAEIELGGQEWLVMPRGFGGNGGMPHMGYKLCRMDAPDLVLALRDADLNQRCINA